MMATKKEAAAQARARGEHRFTWICNRHGEAEHHSSNGKCVDCKALDNKQRNRRRSADPQALGVWNAYQRRYATERRAKDPAYLGERRETFAALVWRKATGSTAMPAGYQAERAALRRFYATLPQGHHADHRCAKVAKDFGGKHVACGLHTFSNLQHLPARLNKMKQAYFDSDNIRDQRPANAYPGGAWDPELTQQEWSRVELLVRRYGEDREATVRAAQAEVARQHQAYLAAVSQYAPPEQAA